MGERKLTKDELKQIIPLQREIAQLRKELRGEQTQSCAQTLRQEDSFLKHAIEIESLTENGIRILCRLRQCTSEYRRLMLFLEQVSDSHVRQILKYRFYNGWTWRKISHEIGGGNTEEGVKKTVYRFLSKH